MSVNTAMIEDEESVSEMNISLEETIRVETSPSSELIANQLSLDDSNRSEQFDTSPIEDLLPTDSALEIVSINSDPSSCMDISRERTTSESSSDTVDYEFDVQITSTLISNSSFA